MTTTWQTNWSFQLEPTAEQIKAMKRHKERYPNDENYLQHWMQELGTEDLVDYLVFIPYSELDKLETLGKGGFAEASLMSLKGAEAGTRPIVLKIFNDSAKDMIRNELRISIHLQYYHYHHPSATRWAAIPHLIGISETDDEKLALVMQYAAGGNLEQYLRKSPPTSWSTIYHIAIGIVRRLQAIHKANIVHMDFHPGNIVFINDNNTNADPNPLIIDVGISMMIKDLHVTSQCIYGRIEYLPPEVFSRTDKLFSKAYDIYSLGIILWQLTSGRAPMGTANALPRAADGVRLSPSLREMPIPGTPYAFEEIYKLCWNPNPDKRPTVNEIVSRLEAVQMKIKSAEWHDTLNFNADSNEQTFLSESMSSSTSRFWGHEELSQKIGTSKSIEQNTLEDVEAGRLPVSELGADVNGVARDGKTPLHFAAESGQIEVVRLLMSELGADVNVITVERKTPLHFAAESGQIEVVRLLVSELGADVNVVARDGKTPLHFAADRGHIEVVRLLVSELGTDVNVIDRNGKTPLHFAVENGHVEVIKLLVRADVNTKEFYNRQAPLHFAAERGYVEVVRLLVSELGADVNVIARDGKTPLHFAAESGQVKVVRLLVSGLGADVNVITKDGKTPLHSAAENGHVEVIKLLVGADANLKEIYNERTPLHMAVLNVRVEVVRLLVTELGADVNVIDKSGRTPLHFAADREHIEVVRLLVSELGADVNVIDRDGKTPLHFAGGNGHVEVIKLLLRADVNAKEYYNEQVPLHFAAERGYVEVVRLLVSELGADVNIVAGDGKTPLHFAAKSGHVEVVRLLVSELGVDVNVIDRDGKTPLHFAAESGHVEVVRLLVSELGADVNVVAGDGMTPLHFAAKSGHIGIIRLLVRADVNAKEFYNGRAPLHFAVNRGYVEVVRLLVSELGADVNVIARNEKMPLHFAAESGHVEVVRLLVSELGVDVNVITKDRETPLHFAAERGYVEVVRLLVSELGADVNVIDRDGKTPLHLAVLNACVEVVRLLVTELGADVNVIDKRGRTPIHFAAKSRNIEVIRLLVGADAYLKEIYATTHGHVERAR